MTIHEPRPHQADLIARIYEAWGRTPNVLAVLPTGGGKSFILARICSEMGVPTAVIAHRAELVGQLSVALAREGVTHRVVGPDALRRVCAQLQMMALGRQVLDPSSRVAVCSVDTLNRRAKVDPSDGWFREVRLWVTDEAHHVLRENKWGAACNLFPNARGLGVTATPCRADGKGLGAHADGVFGEMVVGANMRDLIDQGFLTDYRVVAPPSDIDLSDVSLSASGDYSPTKLARARHRSRITGDVVREYLRRIPGKRAVTFDVDIESARSTAEAFRAQGVRAEMLSSETPDLERARVMREFAAGQILQIVNVDLLGEGVDVPAIEGVFFARPTASYSLFRQQAGRALRTLPGKQVAWLFDHVGNIRRHGLPDSYVEWTLDRRERGAAGPKSDAVPTRTCMNAECLCVYERVLPACPYCGTAAPAPAGRRGPEQVEGDLIELDADVLAAMRGAVARRDAPAVVPASLGPIAARGYLANHARAQGVQAELRQAMAEWGGVMHARRKWDTRAQQRAFWHRFGVDVLTAQALGVPEARALLEKVRADI